MGNATDDPAQKAKGQVQQGVGEAQKQYGDLKEDVKKGKARELWAMTERTPALSAFSIIEAVWHPATNVTASKRCVGFRT